MLEEFESASSEDAHYRTSEAYLYDLTVFSMSGTKLPYLRDLVRFLPPDALVLDYGCGIGADGLLLMEMGYRVAFADFQNPSTRFLRWRLEQRGWMADVYDLDLDQPPPGHDAVFAFDVIEHVPDPMVFLRTLEGAAGLVCVNFLEEREDDIPLHHHLPIDRLLNHAASRRLVRYRRYYSRSHLVVYRPEPSGTSGRLASRVALAAGRFASALRPPASGG